MRKMKTRRKKQQQKYLFMFIVALIVMLALILGVFFLKKANDTNTDNSNKDTSALIGNVSNSEDASKLENTEEIKQTEETEQPQETEQEPQVQDFTMFFTGDVMLQYCKDIYASKGIDGLLSEYLQQEMINADMTMINNEFPFSTRGEQAPDKQYTFRVNPTFVSALLDMGVDVASLANNHALDFGQDALLDTFQTMDDAGISYVGAGATKERAEEAVFVEAGGRKVGVLSASRVIPVVEWNIENCQPGLFCTYDSTRLVQRIKEVESQCDFVVVFVHWGLEKKNYPEEYQRNLAKQYIDAGADLVVGNHAHVPQGIEYYKGVPIVYSLGNYIFNPNMTDTYALKATWSASGETILQVIPVDTREYVTGELIGEEAQALYTFLEEISVDVDIDENGTVVQNITYAQ